MIGRKEELGRIMAGPNPSIKSMLQHEIDHHWKNQNIFLILCGSSVSFMVNDIMGYESPLYGRTTFFPLTNSSIINLGRYKEGNTTILLIVPPSIIIHYIFLFTFNTSISASCNTLETLIPACSAS